MCASLFLVYISEGRKEGVNHLLNESWPRLEGVVSHYSKVSWCEGNTKFCYGACLSLLVSRTSTGDGCLFFLEPRARLQAYQKSKNQTSHDETWILLSHASTTIVAREREQRSQARTTSTTAI